MTFDLASIFSSKARLRVLRTLTHQSASLPLRHIASLSETPLFSVQRVLQQLAEEKMVFKKRKGRYTLFSLNRNHLFFSFLIRMFDLETSNRIAFSSEGYDQKAKRLLEFSHSARGLLQEARSWT